MKDKTPSRYRTVEEIGRGGMGTVYKGLDLTLDRPVAIKVLVKHLASERRFIRRFHREAESAARLNHPNIVHIYDVGESNNLHYLVMEYVDGKTLKRILEEEKILSFEKVMEIVSQTASALDYAHEQGIVHRDVKPGNVLISSGTDQVKMTDFGLALALEDLRLTTHGQILGTPGYISPEQAHGKGVDFTSDIYSLGVMTYEMLMGKHPFASETPMGMVYKHAYEMPPPMVDFSNAVQSVVLKAMAKDPGSRYSSARAFSEDLRAAIADQDKPFLRRTKVPLAALIIAILALFSISKSNVQLEEAYQETPEANLEEEFRVVSTQVAGRKGSGLRHGMTVRQRTMAEVSEAPLSFQEAEIFLRDGKYDKAKEKFEYVLKECPKSQWAERASSELIKLDSKIKEKLALKQMQELNSSLQEVDVLLEKQRYREAKFKCNLLLEQYDTGFKKLITEQRVRIKQEESKHFREAVLYAGQGRIGKALKHFHVISDETLGVTDRIREMGLVLVPAGEYKKRDGTGNIHRVYLNAYYIDRYEVTNERYKKFLPSHDFPQGHENYPVTGVSWLDAYSYAEWAGMQIPTEEEWEKAAFGIEGRKYPWGDEFDSFHCNVGLHSGSSPVGSYPSGVSPYGGYDMVGNVWEWTSSPADASSSWRIIRGASWSEMQVKGSLRLRARLDTEEKRRNVGFRCCFRLKYSERSEESL